MRRRKSSNCSLSCSYARRILSRSAVTLASRASSSATRRRSASVSDFSAALTISGTHPSIVRRRSLVDPLDEKKIADDQLSRGSVHRTLRRLFNFHSVEQCLEGGIVDLHPTGRGICRFRQAKRSLIEAFVENT